MFRRLGFSARIIGHFQALDRRVRKLSLLHLSSFMEDAEDELEYFSWVENFLTRYEPALANHFHVQDVIDETE